MVNVGKGRRVKRVEGHSSDCASRPMRPGFAKPKSNPCQPPQANAFTKAAAPHLASGGAALSVLLLAEGGGEALGLVAGHVGGLTGLDDLLVLGDGALSVLDVLVGRRYV